MGREEVTVMQDWLGRYPDTTRSTYAQIMDDFRALVQVDPEQATQQDMIAYKNALREQAPATVAKKIAAFRSLYTYMNRRGTRADNPAMIVDVPKVQPMRTVKWLTTEQVYQLMQVFDETPLGIRDRAIVSVLLHGLRLGECVGLNVEDYREGGLRVIGKGNKMRVVPLMEDAQIYLETYLARRQSGPMFISVVRHGDRIERRAMRDVVYKATERIGARVHPHALRHSFATQFMRSKGTLPLVQNALGHSDPKTTMMYSHLDTTDLRTAMEQSNLMGTKPTLRVVEGVA